MNKSIVVLERRKFQKKAFVMELGMSCRMDMNDQRAIERQIENQKLRYTRSNTTRFQNVADMEFNMLQITPYIINVQELEKRKFKSARKRKLSSPFDIDVTMNSQVGKLEKLNPSDSQLLAESNREASIRVTVAKEKVKFKTKSDVEVRVSQVSA